MYKILKYIGFVKQVGRRGGELSIMATTEQKKKLLKAKIAVALHDELGRVPKKEEIEQVFLLARVMYKAVLGLHFQRQEQKKSGQLAIF